jgi:hypothetical protein
LSDLIMATIKTMQNMTSPIIKSGPNNIPVQSIPEAGIMAKFSNAASRRRIDRSQTASSARGGTEKPRHGVPEAGLVITSDLCPVDPG